MEINQLIEDNSMQYSAYVLLHRCLVDLRDGVKPIHRMILYSMLKNRTFDFTKSANVCGKVMEFSPHGDSYDTVVNLVQKDKQLVPFILGKGNFAQHTSRDLQPAASRYSEVKLSPMALEVMSDLNKNIVDFVDNYDGTQKMPVCFPVKYPAVLCYANIGIGVGMSSSICSFNMNEVNNAVVDYIKTGDKQVLVPDFATGGFILRQNNELESINNTGLGSVLLRAKCVVDKNVIRVLEIPYTTTREAIIDKVIKLVKDNKLKSVTSIKDLTDLKGMCIEITCKKSSKMDEVLEFLYKNTPLQSTFSVQMRMLVDGLPKVLGVWDVIDKWLEFRTECVIKSLVNDIEQLKKRKHILDGFKLIIDNIDDVISIIRKSEDHNVVANLITKFKLTDVQAQYISDMKLRNLTKTYIDKQLKEFDENIRKTKELQEIVKTPQKINELIIEDLKTINQKFKTPRRSEILC